MFIHVPNAWLSMFVWGVMSLASLGTLVWRHPLADVAAKSAAPIGAAFTFLALVTGSLWGRPMWGTYWEWDARLTSVLMLFLMYLGLMALWRAVEDPSRAARAAAVLTLVGAINLPIIKFSVDWWNTLHQPASVFRMGGSTLDRAFLIPLLVMAIAFTLLFVTLHLAAMRNEILRRRVRSLQMMQASQQGRVMSLGPYASFIVTAYALVALVLVLLIGWIVIDYRNQTQRLRALEESGVAGVPAAARWRCDERRTSTSAPRNRAADGAAADRVRWRWPRCSGCGSAAAIRRKFRRR